MAEIKEKASIYLIHMICEECKKGKMTATGEYYEYDAHLAYVHKCEDCGIRSNFDRIYPRTSVEPEEK